MIGLPTIQKYIIAVANSEMDGVFLLSLPGNFDSDSKKNYPELRKRMCDIAQTIAQEYAQEYAIDISEISIPKTPDEIEKIWDGFETRVSIDNHPETIIKVCRCEVLTENDWIMASYCNADDEIRISVIDRCSLYEMRKIIAEKVRNSKREYDDFDYGTTNLRSIEKNGKDLRGYAVFSDYHIDYTAIKLRDIRKA